MASVIQIPWYATLFRSDKFAAALTEIAPIAMRYGALDYEVYRSKDDPYKFVQSSTFDNKANFERYWYGPEMIEFRTRYSSWYQVPVVYGWHERIASGARGTPEAAGEPVPVGDGEPAADVAAH